MDTTYVKGQKLRLTCDIRSVLKNKKVFRAWEVIEVDQLYTNRSDFGATSQGVLFMFQGATVFAPLSSVEPITSCICSSPVRAIGCRCGYEEVKQKED